MCLPLYTVRVARSLASLILFMAARYRACIRSAHVIYGCAHFLRLRAVALALRARLHSLRSCALCFQHWPQGADEFVDLFLRDDEWREHAQYSFMRAIENESLLQK